VVDDDPASSEIICRHLEKSGFRTAVARSGASALEFARATPPAAVTLDVMLPDNDGWSVLESLKADPTTAAIPVVMLTVLRDRRIGLALGAKDFLTKPVDGDQLVSKISSALSKTSAQPA